MNRKYLESKAAKGLAASQATNDHLRIALAAKRFADAVMQEWEHDGSRCRFCTVVFDQLTVWWSHADGCPLGAYVRELELES